MEKKRFQVKTFPANRDGDKAMEEWLNQLHEENVVAGIHTTLITEDEFKERTKDAKKVEDKMQISKVQVIVHFK